nr:zinc finger, CCHC-type [Tanacetum cinerariifolium]
MQDKLRLSKSQGALTPTELKRMQNVPYSSAVVSIMLGVVPTIEEPIIEDKLDYLEQLISLALIPAQAGQQVAPEALAAHAAWVKGSKEIAGLMLMTMELEIQLNLENLGEERQFVKSYVLKIKSYIDNLECLCHLMSLNLGVSLILISLRKEFDSLVQNYNMHSMGKTINELHSMLKLHEQTRTKKDHALHGLRGSRKLKLGALSLYVGNGQRAAVEAIGSFHLCLPSGLVIVLNNCHYAPSITRRIISVSHLYDDGFINSFVDNAISVFRNNLVYFSVVPKDEGRYITDRGGEYMSQEFLDHLKEHGIIARRTPPYMLQHNGVSERRNRTLLDMVRSMMSQTTLPKSFWDYALETAARILNMVPTKKFEKTSYKVWHGIPKGKNGLFFLLPSPLENKVLVAQNGKFLENSLINQEASRSLEDIEIIQEEDTHPSINTGSHHEEDDLEIDEHQSDIIPIRRSIRIRHAPNCMCLYVDVEEHELGDLGEPANYKAALLDFESDKWLDAMNVEIQSMKDNEKIDMDEAVHTYKARLVVKSYTQTPGINYVKTFSPVADIRAIRILIAIAVFYDNEIWQMDVKTSFLNGYLFEEVYMEQPEGNNIPMLQDVKFYLGRCSAMNPFGLKIIYGLDVLPTNEESINMYCDNNGAIDIANESGITKGSYYTSFLVIREARLASWRTWLTCCVSNHRGGILTTSFKAFRFSFDSFKLFIEVIKSQHDIHDGRGCSQDRHMEWNINQFCNDCKNEDRENISTQRHEKEYLGDPLNICSKCELFVDVRGGMRLISIPEGQLNYPSFAVKLGPSQTFTRTVTNVGDPCSTSYDVTVVAPKGVSVIVNPNRINLTQMDEKATYSVTFARTKEDAGEYSQGHITWVSTKYMVRSVISVNFM